MKMRPNKNVPLSKPTRIVYGIAFVFGLVLLGTGVALYSPGADVTNILALFFGASGAFIVSETFGRTFGWEK
jgi:hypothetical protein